MGKTRVVGLILAGGRSSRMGQDKAFVTLAGETLLARAVARLAPQVDTLAISANGPPAPYLAFTPHVLADLPAVQDSGPLGGILAGLTFARAMGAEAMATLPCDAPFAPMDLVARLQAAAHPGLVAMAAGTRLVPTCALWSVHCLPQLLAIADSGERSVRRAALALGPILEMEFVTGADGLDPFLNLNRPEDVAAAAASLRDRPPMLK